MTKNVKPSDNRYGGRTKFPRPEQVKDAVCAPASRIQEARRKHHGENAKPRKHSQLTVVRMAASTGATERFGSAKVRRCSRMISGPEHVPSTAHTTGRLTTCSRPFHFWRKHSYGQPKSTKNNESRGAAVSTAEFSELRSEFRRRVSQQAVSRTRDVHGRRDPQRRKHPAKE